MKNLKKLCLHNSIFRFMISYTGVLFIPLLVCLLSYQFAFKTVKAEIKANNFSTLTHSKNLIDSQLQTINALMMQSADNSTIISFANQTLEKASVFFSDAVKTINELAYIFKYSNTDILEDVYLYVDETDYIVTRYDLYRTNLYYEMALKEELSYKEWISQLADDQNHERYMATNEKIKSVQKVPFGSNQPFRGVIVCNLSKEKLKGYFEDLHIDEGASLFITDKNGHMLLKLAPEGVEMPIIPEKYKDSPLFEQKINGENNTIFNLSSTTTDWNYMLVLPENVVMDKITNLKSIITLLFLLAVAIGVAISFYMARQNGKPIEEVKKQLLDMNEDVEVAEISPTSFLSGTITHIMSQKQSLANEIEKQKPYLESILFQKLIKGEFASQKEINSICQRIEIDLDAEAYWIANCRFFGNNDMYNLDEQTIEAVNLLKILLKEMIQKSLPEKMFFYDLDQLTTTVILPKGIITYDRIKQCIHEVNGQMRDTYEAVPCWGLSKECNNLLQLWRAFEQSKAALKSGIKKGKGQLSEYSILQQDDYVYYYPQVLEKQLMSYIKEGNREGIKKLLNILYTENFENRYLSVETIDKLYLEMKGTILKLTKQENIPFSIESIEDYMVSKQTEDIKTCFAKMKDLYLSISATFSQEKQLQQSKLIYRIIDYINEEYTNANLGLGMIATTFNISEGYVSSLFKDQAGINFTDYVEKQRIRKACELLKTTEMNINEISEKVGYNSVQSFRRAFKRLHGFKPSELRKSHA